MKAFTYQPAKKIINWGCTFDSLLELKFAISIRKDYYFLRSHIPIFFDPRNNQPTDYIRQYHLRYTPDFLIRHKETNEAFLIETKPRAFEHEPQLIVRKKVAENYIRWRKLDWTFKVVFHDEIKLSDEERKEFHACCNSIGISQYKLALKRLNDRYDISRPTWFKNVPSSKIVHYVMFGEWNNKQRSSVVSSLDSL